jgi:hypothetical protein
MSQQRARRWLMFALALILVAWLATYLLSFKSVTVTYHHAKRVLLYKTSALDAGKSPKPAATITASGTSTKLRSGNYTAFYEGESGYESKYQPVDISTNHQVLKFEPGYSQERLEQMRRAEYPAIVAALQAKYPRIGLYTIAPGQLFRQGEWYGTRLVYRGNDIFNSDTLRVVLHKEGGAWVIKTDPPSILLSSVTFPDVPKDVLRDTNNQL